jgi:hypothetical protein
MRSLRSRRYRLLISAYPGALLDGNQLIESKEQFGSVATCFMYWACDNDADYWEDEEKLEVSKMENWLDKCERRARLYVRGRAKKRESAGPSEEARERGAERSEGARG